MHIILKKVRMRTHLRIKESIEADQNLSGYYKKRVKLFTAYYPLVLLTFRKQETSIFEHDENIHKILVCRADALLPRASHSVMYL